MPLHATVRAETETSLAESAASGALQLTSQNGTYLDKTTLSGALPRRILFVITAPRSVIIGLNAALSGVENTEKSGMLHPSIWGRSSVRPMSDIGD